MHHTEAIALTTTLTQPTSHRRQSTTQQQTCNNTTQPATDNNNRLSVPSVPIPWFASPFTMDPGWQPSRSVAQRRRGQRLRAALRHERQSIAMALAEFSHHSSRGQRMARGGRCVREEVHGRVSEAPTLQEPGTQHFPRHRRCAGARGLAAWPSRRRQAAGARAPSMTQSELFCPCSLLLRSPHFCF